MSSAYTIARDLVAIKKKYGEDVMLSIAASTISFFAVNWNDILLKTFDDIEFQKIIKKEDPMAKDKVLLAEACFKFPELSELAALEAYAHTLEQDAEKNKLTNQSEYNKLAVKFLDTKMLFRRLEARAKKEKEKEAV